jgi:hypothetical protein
MHSSARPHATPTPSGRDPAVLAFSLFGVQIEVRVEDASLVERILTCLPPGRRTDTTARIDRTYEILRTAPGWSGKMESGSHAGEQYLLADRSLVSQSSDADALCHRFQSDLERFLAIRARTHAVVQAGVVGWQGRAIVIPGRRVSGKTTVVEALMREGAEYYSDDYAVIDPNGFVSPCPRPLWIRRSRQLRQDGVFQEPGVVLDRAPLPIRSIIVTEYQPGAAWQPRRLTPGEAVLALLANAPAARHQPGYLLRTFGVTARGAVTWSGPRGDAAQFARDLLNQLATDSR